MRVRVRVMVMVMVIRLLAGVQPCTLIVDSSRRIEESRPLAAGTRMLTTVQCAGVCGDIRPRPLHQSSPCHTPRRSCLDPARAPFHETLKCSWYGNTYDSRETEHPQLHRCGGCLSISKSMEEFYCTATKAGWKEAAIEVARLHGGCRCHD